MKKRNSREEATKERVDREKRERERRRRREKKKTSRKASIIIFQYRSLMTTTDDYQSVSILHFSSKSLSLRLHSMKSSDGRDEKRRNGSKDFRSRILNYGSFETSSSLFGTRNPFVWMQMHWMFFPFVFIDFNNVLSSIIEVSSWGRRSISTAIQRTTRRRCRRERHCRLKD